MLITKLKVDEDLNPETNDIISNYWEFEGISFINTPESIASKYNMSLTELHQLIANHSTFYFQSAGCVECGIEDMSGTKIQIDVWQVFDKSFWMCNDCYDKAHDKLKILKQKEKELRKEINTNAINNAVWQKLKKNELTFLIQILRNKVTQFEQFESLRVKNIDFLYNCIEKFSALGLINIKRSVFQVGFESIEYPDQLIVALSGAKNTH
jgi:hypothetical protein